VTLDIAWMIAGAVTERYRAAGYFLSRAYVPQQKILDGQLRIEVVEGYIAKVDLNDDAAAPSYPLRETMSDLLDRRPAKASDLESALLRLNDLPGLSFRAVLSPLSDPGQEGGVMLTLIPERKPGGGQISFDNFGSRFLGPYVSSAVYSGSLLPLQQTLISVITSVPFREFQNAAIDHSFALTPSLSMHFNGGLTHAEPGDTLKRPGKAPADQVLKDVRRQTRRQYSAEEKVRIVKDCAARKISTSPAVEGIAASMYYSSEEGITILNGVPATYQRLKTGQYPEIDEAETLKA